MKNKPPIVNISGSKTKTFSHRQQQRIEQKLERVLLVSFKSNLLILSLLSNDDLESLARNLWGDNKAKPLSEYTKL